MKHRRKMRELWLAMGLLTVAVVAAFAPDDYLPMLFRAFLLPTAAAMACCALLAVVRKAYWAGLAAGFSAALLLSQMGAAAAPEIRPANGSALRVFHMNVLQPNRSFDQAIAQALQSNADVLSVQEVDPRWADALARKLGSRYPYVHLEPRSNCYGIALFSRLPFTAVRTVIMGGSPFIEALLEVDHRPVRLWAVHATSPTSYGHYRRRNEQLAELAEQVGCGDTATIVVGDLNAVPWDRAYRRFCASSGLRSTTPAGQRTWPAMGPLALIPLDHVLLSPGLAHVSLRTVPIPGSDHRGLLAELAFVPHVH